MKVFLDANILFSASEPKSATYRLLMMLKPAHALRTSEHAWEEARRNLERKRPHLLAGLSALHNSVVTSKAHQAPTAPMATLADKDIPILAGAIGSGSTHLWTSDRTHFGHLYGSTIEGVTIVSSIQLADLALPDR